MAKSQEQIIAGQAQEIKQLKQAVNKLEQMLRELDRKAARANEGVRLLRNDVVNIKHVISARG